MATCGGCGRFWPDTVRFCSACGSPLAVGPSFDGRARKTVTVLFADVVGWTELGERLDPETVRQIMARYFHTLGRILQRHGGTVEKFVGDAVMAVFGIPVVHEDDALRATRAAIEMAEALRMLNDELERRWGASLEVSIGVNTGEVVADDPSDGQVFATGDPVNVAARLQDMTKSLACELVVSDEVRANAGLSEGALPAQEVTIRGRNEPMVVRTANDARMLLALVNGERSAAA